MYNYNLSNVFSLVNLMINYYISKFAKNNDLGYPYSYLNILSKYQFYKSYQILMMKDKAFVGIARLHYINNNVFELGDFFIFENFRGKTHKNKKYSQHLIEETIKEANKVNKDLKTITLAVSEENIPAIKLYSKNNFVEFENKSKFRLKSTKEHKFVYMKLDL